MCFPRLNKCFCCCSLRTGITLICWMGLLWNGLMFFNQDKPYALQYFNTEIRNSELTLTGSKLKLVCQLYYMSQIVIYFFALIGVYSNKSFFLNLLVFSETIILLLFFLMTLTTVSRSIIKNSTALDQEGIQMSLLLGTKYYLYLITISFYYEVIHGRDGRMQSATIFNQHNSFFPPSAPSAADLPTHAAHFVHAPYPVQPTMVETQPLSAQDDMISQMPVYPCEPPPYPTIVEKPPPYAP